MNEEVNYKGHTYRWADNQWYDAQTNIIPPRVIQQELNLRFRNTQPAKPKTKKAKTILNKRIRETIGPLIVNFVQERYAETQSFVPRDEIAAYLLSHPQANTFLQEAYAQSPKERGFEWYVGNQVDWLGGDVGTDRSEFGHLLEKTTLADGKRGYRPK